MPTVLITGASRGLGLEFTRQYAAEGWRVHACCRDPDKAEGLKGLAGEVHRQRLDVTDGEQVARLARDLKDEPIDLLINNAGIYEGAAVFGETDFEAWREVLDVNTLGPLRMAEAFVDQVAASGRRMIVGVSAVMGSIERNEAGGDYPYRTSKAALHMITKGLSVELAARGVIAVAISPGSVRTDMSPPDAELSPEESVAAMRAAIDALTPADSGHLMTRFGEHVPW
jgi:NAD(P)-dependent dehydrogenase (short-subunit alcohol dehydrogenase family)